MTAPQRDRPAADTLRWLGLGLMLIAATARALTPFGDLPHWDLDPLEVGAPMLGIGPAGSLVFDCGCLLGAGLALLGEALSERRILGVPSLLAGVGAAAIVLHGWVIGGGGGGSLGDQRVGASWAAAVAAGLAMMHLGRDPALRRITLAVVLGLVAVLALRGAQQVFLEHPQTVEDYKRNRDVMLAAQGWTADSPMARQYERRLMQPEATGWYGLANVYASVAAAAVVAGLTMVGGCALLRSKGTGQKVGPWVVLVVVGLFAAIGALVLAGAKGGFVAAALGIGIVAVAVVIRWRANERPHRWSGWLGVGAIGLPLALVIVRGLVGERIGELSLLFRWYYAQASVRIGIAHPLLGVGPDGFQQAYMLAKSPLSPEDVKSPHSILLDYGATMGLVGFAWCGLLLWAMWTAGRSATERPSLAATKGDPLARAARGVCLVAAVATILGAWLDRGFMTIDGAVVRVAGLGLWCLIGVAGLRVLERLDKADSGTGSGLCVFGAAAAIVAHAQIDLVASWPGSAGLFWIVVGAAAAAGLSSAPLATARPLGLAPGAAVLALAGLVGFGGAARAARWESGLAAAASGVSGLGGVQREAAGLARAPASEERDRQVRALAHDLARKIGRPVEPNPAAIESAVAMTLVAAIPVAVERLLAARAIYPDEWRTGREASRLCLVQAQLLSGGPGTGANSAIGWASRAVEIASAPAEPGGKSTRGAEAGELGWLSLVYQSRSELLHQPADLAKAADVLERSIALDPYNLDAAMRLMRLAGQLGQRERAAKWATRALELDEQSRLDQQAHGLRESERNEARAAAGKS